MTDPTPAFTAFGRVAAKIAACEQVMRLALAGKEVETAGRSGDAGPERFQKYISKAMTWDFGQLAHRVRTKFALSDDPWLQIFKDAKILRNSIAHDFWSPYYMLLRHDEGVDIIKRHCEILEQHFEHFGAGLLYATSLEIDLYLKMLGDIDAAKTTIAQFEIEITKAEELTANLPQWPSPQSEI